MVEIILVSLAKTQTFTTTTISLPIPIPITPLYLLKKEHLFEIPIVFKIIIYIISNL